MPQRVWIWGYITAMAALGGGVSYFRGEAVPSDCASPSLHQHVRAIVESKFGIPANARFVDIRLIEGDPPARLVCDAELVGASPASGSPALRSWSVRYGSDFDRTTGVLAISAERRHRAE